MVRLFIYNLELSVLSLRHSRKIVFLAITTIALGLSACMTTLTILHVLSADPLPGLSKDLYLAWADTLGLNERFANNPQGVSVNEPSHMLLRDALAIVNAHSADQQVALAGSFATVEDSLGGKALKDQPVLMSTSSFASEFGLQIVDGRFFSDAEDESRQPVVVIDEILAHQLFGASTAIGKSILIGSSSFRIIGVSRPRRIIPHFYDLDGWVFDPRLRDSVFIPLLAGVDAGLTPNANDGCEPNSDEKNVKFSLTVDLKRCAWVSVWVRLEDSVKRKSYLQFLENYAKSRSDEQSYARPSVKLYSLAEWLIRRSVVPDSVRLNIVLAFSFLLLCVANLSGLLTARFLRKSAEIGIRRALGASKAAIFWQHITEASLICVIGGAFSIPLMLGGLWVVRQQAQDYAQLVHADVGTLGLLFVLVLSVGMIVGAIPALFSMRIEPSLQIRAGS